jgi:transcriptional regulator
LRARTGADDDRGMYVPAHFAADDATTRDLLRGIASGHLVTHGAAGLQSTLLPLLVHEGPDGVALQGHLARNNPQWQDAGPALVIVPGAQAYITPSWYAAKREHGRVVPTWDYTVLHVYGRLVAHDDAAWTEDVVRRLTDHHEADRDEPWSVDDAPAQFVAGQLRAIVGVELVVERVEAKLKWSQNRSADDIDGVVAGLASNGDGEAAALVERYRP